MRSTEDNLSEIYLARFEKLCEKCGHRTGEECGPTGYTIDRIRFEVGRYFKSVDPKFRGILCTVFSLELEPSFAHDLKQVPAKLAFERARREVGPRTLTGKKMIEGR